MNIPVLVLIREPEDAIKSLMVREPWMSATDACHDYVSFYSRVEQFHGDVVWGAFDDVTKRYDAVMDKVNRFFGTDFQRYVPTSENDRQVFAAVDQVGLHVDGEIGPAVARPSKQKEILKVAVATKLASANIQRELDRAKRVYDRILSRSWPGDSPA